MKYTVVFEKTPNNCAAFSPDIPGCVSTANTPEEMRLMIREAIEGHFDEMNLSGYPIPKPAAQAETVKVAGREYLAVFEKDDENYSVYVPDFLPALEVTGGSMEEVRASFRRGIANYVAMLKLKERQLPEPSAWAETMEIPHSSRVSAK